MADFAQMGTMDIWYARFSEPDLMNAIKQLTKAGANKAQAKQGKKRAEKLIAKARTRDSLQALSKLAEVVDGQYRIIDQPPIVVPLRKLPQLEGMSPDDLAQLIHGQFRAYRSTLQDDRRRLLERFEVIDVARKVVGVGSVGTRAFIVLLQGRDQQDPLFLQVKEATRSVLEDHLPKSRFKQPGERVVQGQRMMQAASDIYLGWTKGVEENRFLYWRQLRDMKGSVVIEAMPAANLEFYAGLCGWTLARAHARSGDPIAIAAYLGKSRRVRPGADGLLRAVRRSERAGLRGLRRRGALGPVGGSGRYLKRHRGTSGQKVAEHSGRCAMSDKDLLVVLGASYDSKEAAEADYEAVKALYKEAGVGHAFDAAVLERGADGKVKVADKHEASTRHDAWVGLAIGAVAAILPGIGLGVGAAVGAGVGAVTGHLKGGMSNDDLKELGTVLDKGEAGLIVIYATNMADQIAASIKAQNRFVSKAIDADADELAKQLKATEGS